MPHLKKIKNKILPLKSLKSKISTWQKAGDKIVFTNGCFDVLHRGHIEVLAQTANLGDRLIIGLNSDISIQELKGKDRPIVDEESRAIMLAALSFVDAIIFFSQKTPLNLIRSLKPDILAKGGDYKIGDIVGGEIVRQNEGEVVLVPFIDGFSSTNIINKIKDS
tara:strand:+ start:787 stop:1278 length:492 start_codon:yes stop_codon:yes gene_type:complete